MSEKKKLKIEQIREIFPQTTTEDIVELLENYNNDVQQVISILTQRSEEYSWQEVKKKKPQKPLEQKQPRKQGKPRTDYNQRRTQYSNNATPKPFNNQTTTPANTPDSETDKTRQPEIPHNQDQQTQQFEGYRSYGRGRGYPPRSYPPRQGGEAVYGRGRGFQSPNGGAPRYPPNPRYPNSYHGDRQYNQTGAYNQPTQTAAYDQTAPNHQAEVLTSNQNSSSIPPVEEPQNVPETPDEIYQNETEPSQVPTEVVTSLEEMNLEGHQFSETEASPSPNSSMSERETSFQTSVPSESKASKTSPGQNIPNAAQQRPAPKAAVQRWKVKETPSPTTPPSTQNLQVQDENPSPVPQHTQLTPESDSGQEQYVQHPPQTTQSPPPPSSVPSQTSTAPQPSTEQLDSETSHIETPTSNSQSLIQNQTHEPTPTHIQPPSPQQTTSQSPPVSTSHSVGSVPHQQPVSQPTPTSPQTSHPTNTSSRSKVVILPSGLRNDEQVAFKFGNLPSMMYGDSKPSLPLSDDHGLSLGDITYKTGTQAHRDVHSLQDYHTTEPELQEPIPQMPYPYAYVFPYMEDGSQDVQRMARMGMPQPYYEPYLGFRQSMDPKPYQVNRGSPISGSAYGSRDKYHPDSSNPAQANQNSNALSQQPQNQTVPSQQIPQQQSQQAQQPPPTMLPQYYNSPQFYGYSYFPGQYTYQGMPGTHYPYQFGRNFGYYKGGYPNYPSSAYAPGTPMPYEDDFKYMNMGFNPSFFPEGLTGASITSSKTAPVGTGSPASGQNTQHLGGHVPKGQQAYSPNMTTQTGPLGSEKPGSDFKNYSPNTRDTSSFYQQIPTQIPPYFQPTTGYPPAPNRMIQPQHHQHHQHHHLHQQPNLPPQGQTAQQSQGVQGQQPGSTQGPQQPAGQQSQTRPQAQTQAQ